MVASPRPLLFHAVLCLAAGLSGLCGIRASDTGRPLQVATFFAEFMPGLRETAAAYQAETGAGVRVQGIPYAMHPMWVRTQFLSGSPPDVLILEGTDLPWMYGQAGLLERCDRLLEEPNAWDARHPRWGDFFEPDLVQLSRDATGALWALPFTQYRVGFFYDRTAYARLGIREPDTWSGLVENFRATTGSGLPAIAVAVKSNDAQSQWMGELMLEFLLRPAAERVNLRHAEGWRFAADDPASVRGEVIDLAERIVAFERGLIDPAKSEAFAEVARLLAEFSKTWRPDFLSLDGEQIFTLFAGGRVAHFLNGTWYVRELRELQKAPGGAAGRPAFAWGVFPFPQLDTRATALPLLGRMPQNAGMRACILMPKRSAGAAGRAGAPEGGRRARVLRFVQYLTSPAVASRFFGEGDVYDPPALRDVSPRAELRALLAPPPPAVLGMAHFNGYDAESTSEFWTAWQRFLGGRVDRRGFLEELSGAQRRALQRLAARYLPDEDRAFVERELGRKFQ
ncbi:MAG: ABC transporter substrate-binding protein [Opitutaceae bacterium]|jgi:ABC-type glycerol-3-phosphate transport system substrate-binding protein|nr:ABC transporter substrate-binding protein [Opitutaceae bacterium]